MRTAKEIKKELKIEASKDPDKFYATDVLRDNGYVRKVCKCGIFFWTVNEDQDVCGDSACSGGFRLFENNPCKKKLSYIEVWQEFAKMFKELGYTPVKRYPVVARWNPTAEFVMASIAAFQPYVISGEVEPPANPLVIPQFCVRFSDIENIGITANHQTGFVMIGQHMFVPPKDWDQDRCFKDILKWLTDGLGLPFEEITFHEDAWAGGGNAGPCMEFFSRGVELGNQVYMLFEQTPDDELVDLKLKVLDMGMGMERNAWFSQATPTQHQAVYPFVVNRLIEKTGVKFDPDFMKKFMPLSGMLNIDEVEDIDAAWKEVAKLMDADVKELREKILPLAGIFSIADHTRTLLFALTDGALPSNVGGGYNLRMLVRRALSFVDKLKWDIRLADVCSWHAEELKPIFPELSKSLDDVSKILDVERQKYEATKQKIKQIVEKIIKKDITENTLLELYDSNGIAPELVKEEAAKLGKEIEIPENFFGKVSERHEKKEQVHATKREEKLDLEGVPETKAVYFDDYSKTKFSAKVLKVIDNNIILDQTFFYPTSGGQINDIGTINDNFVLDVFKQGAIIVHVLKDKPLIKEGDEIKGEIDFERRRQLSQHHSAAHIINYAAENILGSHINQAGAKKTEEKAHLDITHYQSISKEEQQKIEDEANRIVKKGIPINKMFMQRSEAEKKYGMAIYQGGAVPGKNIRIVEIPGLDVEACGGTHLNNTSEIGKIRIINTSKIQDGIVRITFTAGKAAEKISEEKAGVIDETAKLLGCESDQIPGRVKELFGLWKKIVKKKKDIEFKLNSTEKYAGDVIEKSCEILRTQPEHLTKTINRFIGDIKKKKDIKKKN